MRQLCLALAGCAVALSAHAQSAADYPSKPIKFISTTAPGSPSDLLARLLGEKMGPILKATFLVDNKPGAGGLIAMDAVAKSAPDGYTLGLGGASTHVILPAVRSNMPYDSVKDFAYMGQLGTSPGVIVATMDFPANNIKELIALAKSHPELQYASWGTGSTGNFCGEMLNQRAGIKIQHIPYKSVAQIQTDLYGGHIKLAQVDGGSAPPMVKSGKVKAIGTCTGKHISFPQVRSYEDEGILDPAIKVGQFRFGLYAAAGTPKAITDRLEQTLKVVLELPDVQAKMLEMGLEPRYLPGEVVRAMTIKEVEQWRKVAKTASIKLD